jgi:hypothetical protein
MAFSGLHVAAGYIGQQRRFDSSSLFGHVAWSATLPSPGMTTQVAPASGELGDPVFAIRASADAYAAAGPSPDASSGQPRTFVPVGETVYMYVAPGDKLAWAAA